MNYYVVDSDNWEWTQCESLVTALHVAEETIQYYRDNCDPEWSMSVEDIVIVYGERDPDHNEYDGCQVIYRASEIDRVELEPEDVDCDCEYYCDYKMKEVV